MRRPFSNPNPFYALILSSNCFLESRIASYGVSYQEGLCYVLYAICRMSKQNQEEAETTEDSHSMTLVLYTNYNTITGII